eukprot:2743308-Ditylum_brightwellii.AAC.1
MAYLNSTAKQDKGKSAKVSFARSVINYYTNYCLIRIPLNSCFVESRMSKAPGLNPGRGQLKVKSIAMRSVTGACRGRWTWVLMAL